MSQKVRKEEYTVKGNSSGCTIEDKDIGKTWISGQNCCTLIISKKLAEKYGLTEPSHVILQGTSAGILIRKLDI